MIGSSDTTKNLTMAATAASTKEKDSLRLTLSPSLSLSISTLKETKSEPEIKIIKEEFKQVGTHKLLKKTVIQLTQIEYALLKTSFNSIDSFINFVNSTQHVQQTTPRSDEEAQCSTIECNASKVLSSDQSNWD